MLISLTAVNPDQPVVAIRALRLATNLSLKAAKLDIYDRVKAGEPVSVDVPADALDALREAGWVIETPDPIESALARLRTATDALMAARVEYNEAVTALGETVR